MKELNKKLNFLTNEIKKKVFKGTAKAYNKEVSSHFVKNKVLGVTLQHFKPLVINGSFSKEIIAIFDAGYPAVLQQGVTSRAGYNYPYNPSTGTYVSFAEEPNLEEWAKKKYRNYNPKMKGLRIGKETSTGFGRHNNQWVFRAGEGLKSSSRPMILSELRSIKIL